VSEMSFDMLMGAGLVHPYAPAVEHSVAGIMRWTAYQMGFTVEDIRGPRRFHRYFRARCAIVWGARELRGASLPLIAKVLGGRDHTSIMNAREQADAFRESDPAFRMLTERMAEIFERKVA
jgi:chromosomal replication initiation ATPase DnaA